MASVAAGSFSLLLPLSSSSSSSRSKTLKPTATPLPRFATTQKAPCLRLPSIARDRRAEVVVKRVALSPSPSVATDDAVEEAEVEPSTTFAEDLKVYVGNIPFNIGSAQLAGVFSEACSLEMVEVLYDKLTGQSRGFGSVTMSTVEDVEVAVRLFNGYELLGRSLTVRRGPPPPLRTASPRLPNSTANRIHVGNLSMTVDASTLENFFSVGGNVVDARVIYDRSSGKSRGFGFVSLGSRKEVSNAIFSLNGTDLHGQAIRVTIARRKSRPKI